MRQVPRYLLIGNGRVAKHFQHYFTLLKLPFETWHRTESPEKLAHLVKDCTHILVLISDRAIENFVNQFIPGNALCIHFSGSVVTQKAFGAHPLLGFNSHLYELEQYQSVPFILDHNAPEFETLLPGLPNQHVRLHTSQKAKYHALCVLSGNFSCMLWQKLCNTFEQEFHFPASIAFPYLMQQAQNLKQNFKTALTGPLVRNDLATINKNILALESDPFQEIYKSFVTCFQTLKGESEI